MSEIPEDVMKSAEGIASCIPSRVHKVNREFATLVIAREILAERKRCGDIALAIDSGRGNEKEIHRAVMEPAS